MRPGRWASHDQGVDQPSPPPPAPAGAGVTGPLDHRGSRRLSPREEIGWYLAAGSSYVLVGQHQKAVLTWLVGPAWVVATLWLGPALADRVRRRSS